MGAKLSGIYVQLSKIDEPMMGFVPLHSNLDPRHSLPILLAAECNGSLPHRPVLVLGNDYPPRHGRVWACSRTSTRTRCQSRARRRTRMFAAPIGRSVETEAETYNLKDVCFFVLDPWRLRTTPEQRQ